MIVNGNQNISHVDREDICNEIVQVLRRMKKRPNTMQSQLRKLELILTQKDQIMVSSQHHQIHRLVSSG